MQKGKSTHIIKGMNKDMSAATMNSEFAFDAKNIRITPIDEGGLLVVTNEKGNIEIPIVNITRENMVIEGNILGTQVLNNYVIIFTHNEDFDRIYRLEKKEDIFEGLLLYQGNLNFSNDNPIEGLAVYENEEVQKVYWVDGKNQARVINFVVPEEKRSTWIDTSFDFIPELRLEEEVTTSLEYGNGSFHSGVIQYAFTYYNKYGQESNIFYTTSLISIPTEGQASPEDIISCYIKITISNIDTNFDYIRVYSIHRTSLDSTPSVRIVKDVNIKENIIDNIIENHIIILDNGLIGSNTDATELLYKGGETIIPKTFTQKDNTLFLGNINIYQNNIVLDNEISYSFKDSEYKGLKSREIYKIGLQGQYKNGKWSNIFCKNMISIKDSITPQNIIINLDNSIIESLKKENIIKIRIVYVQPSLYERKILAQGIVVPTVFNVSNRHRSLSYAQSFWDLQYKYVHGESILGNTKIPYSMGDIISIQSLVNPFNIESSFIDNFKLLSASSQYNFDCNVINFYSPEIEFGYLDSINMQSYKINILGHIFFDKTYKALDIQSVNTQNYITDKGYTGIKIFPWRDVVYTNNKIENVDYTFYIWQNNRLNNLLEDTEYAQIIYNPVELKSKKIGLHFSTERIALSYSNYAKYDIQDFRILKPEDSPVITMSSFNGDINYSKDVDTIITTSDKYPTIYNSQEFGRLFTEPIFSDPISMKYKSGNYAVISLGGDSECNILPYTIVHDDTYINKYPEKYMYDIVSKEEEVFKDFYEIKQPYISITGNYPGYGTAYIAEIVKEEVVMEYNEMDLWLPISNSYNIENINTITLTSNDGDTYYNKYSCLKVYPYDYEDINSVTTIIEFPCETKVNLDGIYSKIGNYLSLNPENFNKLNPIYSQTNNFFNYRDLTELFNIINFPNTITWTKEKQAGANIDTWTNITMASTLDLDGDKGAITSLNTFNNEIYAFQERGLSNILFNSRVQVPTSDGVPIEISNGYKVQGKRYISNSIGCNNKWSIVESPNGLYFIDSDTNSLYLFNGTINSLSDRVGLRGWLSNNNSNKDWNPITYENFRSFYDRNNGDVYFIKDNDCLCFSELLGQFISFYDYTRVPSMFNVEDALFSIKNNKLWKHYSLDNTNIYGENKDYYVTLLSNTEPLRDKIFNNIVCRADGSDNTFFSKIEVWNEYQRGESDLTNIINKPSNLKQKFRTWRVNIPRDNTHKLDRMRNPWLYIKLIGKEHSIKLYGTEVEFFM